MSGEITDFRLIGGRLECKALTSQISEAVYAGIKAFYWLDMLKEGMIPTKWCKPTKKYTRIHYKYTYSQAEMDGAVQHLKSYVEEIKQKYGLPIRWNDGQEETA